MSLDCISNFIAGMRTDPELAPLADEMECALQAAAGNVHLAAVSDGIEWIVSQQKTVQQKYDAIIKFVSLKRQMHIPSLRTFAGWGN
jgi:hypothetical protein